LAINSGLLVVPTAMVVAMNRASVAAQDRVCIAKS
jgi:hypothetical protein